MNSLYSYPAVFTPEENGQFSINFPDLEGCYTCGDNLADGIRMAEDVLAFTLYDYEKDRRDIPEPSALESIHLEPGEFINFIACDTMEYRKRFANAAVKKTLTIPAWLNDEAISLGINFSQVLQEALLSKIQTN